MLYEYFIQLVAGPLPIQLAWIITTELGTAFLVFLYTTSHYILLSLYFIIFFFSPSEAHWSRMRECLLAVFAAVFFSFCMKSCATNTCWKSQLHRGYACISTWSLVTDLPFVNRNLIDRRRSSVFLNFTKNAKNYSSEYSLLWLHQPQSSKYEPQSPKYEPQFSTVSATVLKSISHCPQSHISKASASSQMSRWNRLCFSLQVAVKHAPKVSTTLIQRMRVSSASERATSSLSSVESMRTGLRAHWMARLASSQSTMWRSLWTCLN